MVLVETQRGGKMKITLKIIVSVLAIGYSMIDGANAAPLTKNVIVAINNVYVPGGFDSQTDAYVIVSGIFPNGCYRWKGAEIKNTTATEHEVTSMATVTQGMCIQVLVPFTKDVRIGKLSTGTHTLKFIGGDGTYMERKLVVE